MKKRLSWATLETPSLSVRQKCLILGIHRSRVYYVAQGMDESDVTMMNEIGDLYALRPFQGYKRITDDLKDETYGIFICRMKTPTSYGLSMLLTL